MEINGDNLYRARKVAKHNLPEVSAETGVGLSTLSKLETHDIIPPNKGLQKLIIKYIDKHIKKEGI